MNRLLTCSCGEKIIVSRSQAGQNIACPKCGASNKVPTLRGLSELPTVEAEPEATTKNVSDTWQFRGPVLAICFAIILLAGSYAAFQFFQAWGTRVPFSPAMQIEGEKAAIEQLSPDALLSLWDNYSSASLGPKKPPDYKLFNDYSSSCFKAGIVATCIALVAAVISAVLTLSSRKQRRLTA